MSIVHVFGDRRKANCDVAGVSAAARFGPRTTFAGHGLCKVLPSKPRADVRDSRGIHWVIDNDGSQHTKPSTAMLVQHARARSAGQELFMLQWTSLISERNDVNPARRGDRPGVERG